MDSLFSKNEYLKIGLASIAIIFLLLSSTAPLFTPKKAEASVPVHCTPGIDLNCIKEYALDLVARVIAGSLIRTLTNTIIGWIQGNGGANVGFVGNFEDEFIRQLDGRAGEFLNSLAGVNLCGNIGNLLQISLPSYPYRIYDQFRCTVTDIVDNVDSFFTNFSNGGWPAYIHMTQVPNNNPFGAYLMAYNKKIKLESAAANALHRNVLSNLGFKGFQQKVATTRCVDNVTDLPPSYDPSNPDTQFVHNDDGTTSICFTEYVTKTPGSLVSDMLNRSVGSGYDFGTVSDEIDEAIEAIVYTLMNELINSVQDGLFNPALASLSDGTSPPGSPSCTSDTDRPDSCACDLDAVPDQCATSCIDVTGVGNGICGGIPPSDLSDEDECNTTPKPIGCTCLTGIDGECQVPLTCQEPGGTAIGDGFGTCLSTAVSPVCALYPNGGNPCTFSVDCCNGLCFDPDGAGSTYTGTCAVDGGVPAGGVCDVDPEGGQINGICQSGTTCVDTAPIGDEIGVCG